MIFYSIPLAGICLTTKKDSQFRYSAWGMQSIMWLLSIIKMKRRQINEEGILLRDERGCISFSYKTLSGNPVFLNITSSW